MFSQRWEPQTEPTDDTHSSTSGRDAAAARVQAGGTRTSVCVCVCVPRQAVFSGLGVKPVSHWHWKEPCVFTQCPSKHTPGFTHSSTSTGQGSASARHDSVSVSPVYRRVRVELGSVFLSDTASEDHPAAAQTSSMSFSPRQLVLLSLSTNPREHTQV